MSRISPELRARVTEAMDLCDLIPEDLRLTLAFPELANGKVRISFFIGPNRHGLLTDSLQILCDLWGAPDVVTHHFGQREAVWHPSPHVDLAGTDPADEMVVDGTLLLEAVS